MKENLHPTYFTDAKVVCACGNTFITGSTKQELHVEICSNCHPFYTGKQNLLDIAGTIEKFKKRSGKAAELKSKRVTSAIAKSKLAAESRQAGDKKTTTKKA